LEIIPVLLIPAKLCGQNKIYKKGAAWLRQKEDSGILQ
jgi:hypothetical protein